ncbi:Cna B-type domain-containing protein [Helcococcus sueciensis]|uniref:Cna B-type domain-containing protein n=1 Tax=Helcococcus sueciensis TaxID=241555 RepID=UPI000416847B|nr:Cna B-type domain-containing protein [Helcococcus sueciensis]
MKRDKKRILSLILAFLLLLNVFPIHAVKAANDIEDPKDIFAYEKVGEEIYIKGFKEGKERKDITIPSMIENAPVTKISEKAFFQKGIENVQFGENLLEVGKSAFSGNKITFVNFNDKLKKIDESAFKDNQITNLKTKAVEEIGNYAFANNKINNVDLTYVITVGDYAFSYNNLTSVNVGNDVISYGTGVFANNNRYVLVKTENPNIKTEVLGDAFGQVVNPVLVTVHHVDKDTKEKIITDTVIGDDYDKVDGIVFLGQENTYTPDKISGYVAVEDEIKFTPDKTDYEITVEYKNVKQAPKIEVAKRPYIAKDGDGSQKNLLSFVKATDLDGKDISDKITVNTESIDTSVDGAKYKVVYSVKDDYGNVAQREITFSIGRDWFEFPIGKGWVLGDFTYDENKVIGFSESGLKKVETQKELVLPHLNPNDGSTVIDTVADNNENNSFRSRALTSVSDYTGNIKVIEGEGANWISGYRSQGAFKGNSISTIDLKNVEHIGSYAFMNNNIQEIKFEKLNYIGHHTFQGNQIEKIEATDLPNVEYVGQLGLEDNKLTKVHMPKLKEAEYVAFWENQISDANFPMLEKVGNGAFLSNQITEVTQNNFPNLKYIDERAFNNNKITKIEIPNVVILEAAFAGNPDSEMDLNFPVLEQLGSRALANRDIKEINLPKVKEIAGDAFSGNPGSEEWDNKVVVWADNSIKSGSTYIVNPKKFEMGAWSEDDFTWDPENPARVTGLTNTGTLRLADKQSVLTLPPRAKIVGSGAFQAKRIKEVYGPNIEDIEFAGFYNNQLTDINYSFPNLKKITGKYAFERNNLTDLKLDRVESVAQEAFASNKLTSVNLPSVKSIEEKAFEYNPVSSLELPKVENIGKEAFADNFLTELSLPEVKNIGLAAFARISKSSANASNRGYPEGTINGYKDKGLKKLDAPNLDTLEDLAFAGSKIEELNAPKLRVIKRRALDQNKVKEINSTVLEEVGYRGLAGNNLTSLSQKNLVKIDSSAFANNKISEVYVSDKLAELANNAFNGNRSKNSIGQETRIFIDDYKNPHDLKDGIVNGQRQHIVNPTKVTVDYVDTEGNRIAETINEYILEEKTYKAIHKFNYKVDKEEITVPDNRQINHVKFTYTKLGYEHKQTKGIEIFQANEIDKNTGAAKEQYYIGEVMTTRAYLDLTGIDTSYNKGKLKVFFDPKFIDKDSISIPPANTIEKYEVKDGVIEITLKEISGGDQLDIPINWKFKKYETPDKHREEINYLFENDGEVYSVAKPIYLEGYYKKPSLIKRSPLNLPDYNYGSLRDYDNGPRFMGVLDEYVEESGRRGYHVSEAKPVKYYFSISSIERYVESGTITDTLPTYIAVDENGVESEKTAVFDSELNPAWSLDGDKVSQNKHFGKTLNPGAFFEPLYLSFPGLKSGYNVNNKAEVELVPYDKGNKEENMTSSDDLSMYTGYYEPIQEDGDPRLDKMSQGPRSNGINAYFYDTPEDRLKVIPYRVRISSGARLTDFKNLTATDYDLDERLYYYGVSFPRNDHTAGGVELTVLAMKQNGDKLDPANDTVLEEHKITADTKNSIVFDRSHAKDIDYIHIILPKEHKLFAALEVDINTKLRNPENSVYEKAPNSNKNIFVNNAVMAGDQYRKGTDQLLSKRGDIRDKDGRLVSEYKDEWDNIPGSFIWGDKSETQVRDYEGYINVVKTQTYPKTDHRAVYPLETGDYNLRLHPGVKGTDFDGDVVNQPLDNFEMIDLLPKGLAIQNDGVVMSEGFAQSGGKYEIINDYEGTGRTAIRFTAETLKAKVYDIASIKTMVDYETPEGYVTNEVYVTFDNDKITKLGNKKSPVGDDSGREWLHDEVSFRMQKVREMSARKYIKKEKDLAWSMDGVVTESEGKFDYKLSLINNLDSERTNIDIVDFLPYQNDLSIQEENIGNGKRPPRGTEFENKFDLTREIKVPAGYKVTYWNSDTPVDYKNKSADAIIEELTWLDSPAANTRAIRITAVDGTKLAGNSRLDVEIPMIAPKNDITNNYELTGKKAWNSFVRDDDQTIRFLEPNKVWNSLTPPTGSIILTKFGQEGLVENNPGLEAKPLAGVKFQAKDSKGNFYFATSDENGVVKFTDLPILENYTITEIEAPEGYKVSDKSIEVGYEDFKAVYNKADNSFDVKITDNDSKDKFLNVKPVYGSLKLNKINEDKVALAYIRFNLKGMSEWNKDYNRDFLTNTSGNISVDNLLEGKYLLTEIIEEGKSGYKAVEPIEFTIDVNNRNIDFTGDKAIVNKGLQIVINKLKVSNKFDIDSIDKLTDYGKVKLEGFEFEIREVENPENVIKTNPTGKEGYTIASGLKVNTLYQITEVKKDNSLFLHNPNAYKFKLNDKGELTDENGNAFLQNALNIPNPEKPILGKVEVEKLDDNNNPLEGAVFNLEKYDRESGKYKPFLSAKTKLVDGKAKAIFDNLPSGLYILKEDQAPKGYYKSNAEHHFEIKEIPNESMLTSSAFDIESEKIVHKYAFSYTNNPFEINIIKGDTILENVDLEKAEAYIKENPGYSYKEVGKDLYTVYKPLAGVEFTLYALEDGQRVEKGVFTSNEKGKVDFKDFKFDENYNYELVETKAIENYRLDQKAIKIYLKDEAKKEGFTGIISAYKENEPIKARIIVSKYSEDKKEILAGAEFALYKVEADGKRADKPLKVATTDDKGFIEFRDLELGKYILKETKAPEGYLLVDKEYEFDLTSENASQSIVVNNPLNSIDIPVNKVWLDNNNQDGKRIDSVTVKLLADGQETGQKLVLDQSNDWSGKFAGLAKTKNGQEIVYTIIEEKVEGYTSEITGNQDQGFTVTNTHTPEQIEIKGQKTWDDGNNQDGKRPDQIIVKLFANGKEVARKEVKADENGKWSYSFENLDKYENGEEIVYAVAEEKVEGYVSQVNGYDITNIYKPEKTNINIVKRWNDKNNQDKLRPTSISIVLLTDGKETDQKLVLNKENNWSGQFTDLDEYKDGKKIVYTIREEKVKGYTSEITGNQEDGFVITNTHKPKTPPIPKTGDDTNIALYTGVGLVGLIVLLFISYKKQKIYNK